MTPGVDRQFAAWGVQVLNTRVSAAHVAEGVGLLLAAARGAEVSVEESDDLGDWLPQTVESLKSEWGGSIGLSDRTRALCVYKSKVGPISLSAGIETSLPEGEKKKKNRERFRQVCRAGIEHLEDVLEEPPITRQAHIALASALNADERVAIEGASTPTTCGPALLGYDSNYTLKLLHAPTALALLASHKPELVERLSEKFCDSSDPHSSLVAKLGLLEERPGLAQLRLVRPPGQAWDHCARNLSGAVENFLEWTGTKHGAASKAELLMGLTDLICLFFTTRLLAWVPEGSTPRPEEHSLLVAARGGIGKSERAVVNAARVSVQRALARLASHATWEKGLRLSKSEEGKSQHSPGAAACSLGASSGWVLPLDGRGGARRYLAPGALQLKSLVRALVSPGRSLTWEEFHRRAWEHFQLCLGGVHCTRFSRRRVSEAVIRTAGALNQERLLRLDLARREADNVVVVDGGMR